MELSHHRTGRGEPLLLIHGIGSHWQAWTPVIERLATERDVVAIDMPGFGGSAALPDPPARPARELARAVASFLDAQGLERVHVAGNSLGGWVALELARAGRTRSVTALSPAGFWTPREAAFVRRSLARTAAAARLTAPLADRLYASALVRTIGLGQYYGRPWRVPAAAAAASARALAGSRVFDTMLTAMTAEQFRVGEAIPAPVTIAWAQRDWLLIPRQAKRAAKAVPHARVVTLEGCGHVPTWDDPEQVSRVILEGSRA
jgi:pimeloyl-ACP methyl ester carboxylesterase